MLQRLWFRIESSMDIFSHIFVVKMVMLFFEKTKKNDKRGRGWPIFLKKSSKLKQNFWECLSDKLYYPHSHTITLFL